MDEEEEELTRATRTVLDRYVCELYDARNLSLVPELMADPMYRHDAGGRVTEMTNADCVARISGFFDDFTLLTFHTVHLVVQGSVASWTYQLNMTDSNGTETVISSIETFEVTDGKITRVWNAEHTRGAWT